MDGVSKNPRSNESIGVQCRTLPFFGYFPDEAHSAEVEGWASKEMTRRQAEAFLIVAGHGLKDQINSKGKSSRAGSTLQRARTTAWMTSFAV
jgi:hypothetical protein